MPIEQVYQQIVDIARARDTKRVFLFGSRARGTNAPKSDIDLAIEGCPDFALLVDDLQEHLWSLISIDVVNLDEPTSAALRADILRDGRLLYEKV